MTATQVTQSNDSAWAPDETIGDRIRRTRIHLGLEQSAMAEQLHTSRSMIGRWENNETEPKISTIMKISETLGVDLVWLLKGGCANCCDVVTDLEGLDIETIEVLRLQHSEAHQFRGDQFLKSEAA